VAVGGSYVAHDAADDSMTHRVACIVRAAGNVRFRHGALDAAAGPARAFATSSSKRGPARGVAEQRFTVTVSRHEPAADHHDLPPTQAFYDRPYVYAIGAVDPEGDALTYTLLVNPPPGMFMDAAGVIRFTPPANLKPDPPMIVRVTDGQGGMVDQVFTIALSFAPNQGPTFTSTPAMTATVGVTYEYTLTRPIPTATR
jgi:hypothetical protein